MLVQPQCPSPHGKAIQRSFAFLPEANADKGKANNDDTTALHVASQKGHLQVVRLLLKAKADEDKARSCGATALFMVLQKRSLEVVRLLLEAQG